MGNNQKYSIDFKLQVVGKYEQGKCGYEQLYCEGRKAGAWERRAGLRPPRL